MNNRKIYDIYKSTSLSQNKFTDKDVVRHKLVQDIIKAYEKYYDRGSVSNHGKG